MSGLFRRLRRAPGASQTTASEAVAAEPAGVTEEPAAAGGQAAPDAARADHDAEGTAVSADDRPADGGALDTLVGAPPTTRRRGRLRRRLRHLRRVREVLMRDLGGFVFELHRSAADAGPVVEAKLRRLETVSAEIRELEALLQDRRPLVVREPGIGGACPNCGELFGSEARFCWACGAEVAAGAGHVPQLLAAYTNAHPELQPGTPQPEQGAIEGSAEEAPTVVSEPASDETATPEADGGRAAAPEVWAEQPATGDATGAHDVNRGERSPGREST